MLNPISWCTVLPQDVIFMKWGGNAYKYPGFLCNETVSIMEYVLYAMKEKYPNLDLIIPETKPEPLDFKKWGDLKALD